MTMKRKLPAHRLLPVPALLLALGIASAGASAGTREVAMHGPNGAGGGDCTASDPVVAPDAPAAADSKAAKPPAKAPATRIKPIVPVRGGSDDAGGVHAPRWHSFLPGMFR